MTSSEKAEIRARMINDGLLAIGQADDLDVTHLLEAMSAKTLDKLYEHLEQIRWAIEYEWADRDNPDREARGFLPGELLP